MPREEAQGLPNKVPEQSCSSLQEAPACGSSAVSAMLWPPNPLFLNSTCRSWVGVTLVKYFTEMPGLRLQVQTRMRRFREMRVTLMRPHKGTGSSRRDNSLRNGTPCPPPTSTCRAAETGSQKRRSRVTQEGSPRRGIGRRQQGPRQYVQHVRAVVRLVQKAALHDEAQDLLVGQALIRLLGQRGDLPENNPEGPRGREGA